MMGLQTDGALLAEIATAWVLTYLMHSSLLLGAAWLGSRWLSEAALATRELLWKTALLGGLVTASLQVGLGVEPLTASWGLATDDRAVLTEASPTVSMVSRSALAPAPEAAGAESRRRTEPAAAAGSERPAVRVEPVWRRWLVALWFAGATLLLTMLAVSGLRLRRRLTSRRELSEGRLARLLESLTASTRLENRVRLSSVRRIGVPLAVGIRRPEICLPTRLLRDMVPERQETVLAHELAHHQRRDPAWLLATRLLESLFFFQPLNRIARRSLQEISEYRCDDWAVRHTGRPIALARCLTEVAEWGLQRRGLATVPAMAVDRSRLGRRISRLVRRDYPLPESSPSRWLAVGMAAVLALTVLAAPGVTQSAGEAPAAPAPVDPQERPVAPPPVDSAPPALPADSVPEVPSVDPALPAPPVDTVPVAPSADSAPPAPPMAPSPPIEVEVYDEELEEALEEMEEALEEMEEALEANSELIEASLEPTFEGIHQEMERIGEVLETELEALEPVLEAMEEEFEITAETVVAELEESEFWGDEELDLYTSLPALERLEELAMEMASRYEPDPEAMARLGELADRMAESVVVDHEALARLEEMAARIAEPDPEALARLEQRAQELAERGRPSEEELEALREEARRIAREAMPSEDELLRLREEARRLSEVRRIDEEELAALREEARRIAAEAGPSLEEREQMRQEMQRLREELRREMERLREQMREGRERHRQQIDVQREQARSDREEARRQQEKERQEMDRARAERRGEEDEGDEPPER